MPSELSSVIKDRSKSSLLISVSDLVGIDLAGIWPAGVWERSERDADWEMDREATEMAVEKRGSSNEF